MRVSELSTALVQWPNCNQKNIQKHRRSGRGVRSTVGPAKRTGCAQTVLVLPYTSRLALPALSKRRTSTHRANPSFAPWSTASACTRRLRVTLAVLSCWQRSSPKLPGPRLERYCASLVDEETGTNYDRSGRAQGYMRVVLMMGIQLGLRERELMYS